MDAPRWYYDARTGTIAQYPAAPDPGNWYRLLHVQSDQHDPGQDVHDTLAQGEYPLVTPYPPDELQQMDPQQLLGLMQKLQRRDYEDPGTVFEANPMFAPGSPDRPAGAPTTSQAPPARDFSELQNKIRTMMQQLNMMRSQQVQER